MFAPHFREYFTIYPDPCTPLPQMRLLPIASVAIKYLAFGVVDLTGNCVAERRRLSPRLPSAIASHKIAAILTSVFIHWIFSNNLSDWLEQIYG